MADLAEDKRKRNLKALAIHEQELRRKSVIKKKGKIATDKRVAEAIANPVLSPLPKLSNIPAIVSEGASAVSGLFGSVKEHTNILGETGTRKSKKAVETLTGIFTGKKKKKDELAVR